MADANAVALGHVAACSLPFWGHTKPLCILLSKLVRMRPAYATLFTAVSMLERVDIELTKQLPRENERHLRARIRVVALPSPQNPFELEPYQASVIERYKTLCDGKAISGDAKGTVFYEPIAPPRLLILDFFLYQAMAGVRSITGSAVPVFALQTGSAAYLIFRYGPESVGGNGDMSEKLEDIQAVDEEDRERQIEAICNRTNGQLIEIKGIPPMYDYEHAPQMPAFPAKPAEIMIMSQYNNKFLRECDGIINMSNRLYEPGAFELLEDWFRPRPIFPIGPIEGPLDEIEASEEEEKSPVAVSVELFLSGALQKFGRHSAVYISFGSIAWTSEPGKVWAIIDVLIEEKIPFLLSHASSMIVVPKEVSVKAKASGLGYIAPWLPQQMILKHKACGWFMTHCGHNSVVESLSAGVPLICCPVNADQPMNAVNISVTHNVGYELFEVRSGQGLRPIHRLGNRSPEGTIEAVRREVIDVLARARGEDGEIKRANAQLLRKKYAERRAMGGEAWTKLNELADMLTPNGEIQISA